MSSIKLVKIDDDYKVKKLADNELEIEKLKTKIDTNITELIEDEQKYSIEVAEKWKFNKQILHYLSSELYHQFMVTGLNNIAETSISQVLTKSSGYLCEASYDGKGSLLITIYKRLKKTLSKKQKISLTILILFAFVSTILILFGILYKKNNNSFGSDFFKPIDFF